MKYTISINQLAYSKMGLQRKIDIIDAAILDYIHSWCIATNADRIIIKKEEYTRINYAHMISEMPLLRIKEKDTITARIKKLRAQKLIKTFQAKDNSMYIRTTARCYSIFFSVESDNKNSSCKRKTRYPKNSGRLSGKKGQALSEKPGQQQTNNHSNTFTTTTSDIVVVSRSEIEKVRKVLSVIPYKGISNQLISDLITQKGFRHVYETARMIVKQYTPDSKPVLNPPGHFRVLTLYGMDVPPGYVSSKQEAQIEFNERNRKIKKRKELEGMRYEGIPAEAREFIANLCGRNNHG